MRQLTATLTDRQVLSANLSVLTLSAPDLPQLRPGQLLLLRVGASFDPYLRAPCYPVPFPSANGACLLLVQRGDALAKQLGALPQDGKVDVIAPVGNGFALEAGTLRLLLVGDEAHVAPLLALAREAAQKQIAVTLLLESAQSEGNTTATAITSLLPLDVEIQFAASLADALPALLRWPDQICAAGEPALYALLKTQMAQTGLFARQNFVQVLSAPPMACGFGACLGCAVETVRGMRLACVDGPVFDLAELVPA